jgi:hypothetical protein
MKFCCVLSRSVDIYFSPSPLAGNDQISEFVRLLVIDEMMWLQEVCGPALETVVASITRQVSIVLIRLLLNYLQQRILKFTHTHMHALSRVCVCVRERERDDKRELLKFRSQLRI